MKARESYELPRDKEEKLSRAIRLEWITIGSLIVIAAMMYLVMGSSQTMKTAWFEDLLSLVPPIAFLIATRFRDDPPTEEFPYGYRRAPLIAFLAASVAVLALGGYMLVDNAIALCTAERPTIGHFTSFGETWRVWSGWLMIAALIVSMIPPIILGRLKLPLGEDLHEKTLYADAMMNKADWMTAVAACLGILLVGAGFWWGDAAAALIIAFDVTKDGLSNVKSATFQLMDRSPTSVGDDEPIHLDRDIAETLGKFDGVLGVQVRLKEEGHIFSGEVFVELAEPVVSVAQIHNMAETVEALDWRLHTVAIMPVMSRSDRADVPAPG